jgi:ElaB/YqjD/DUF883 family membrane-anchored ribosome-binding protein
MSKLTESIKTAADSAKDGMSSAKLKANESSAAARRKAAEAYEKSKDVAARSVQSSKVLASKAATKSGDAIDNNPLAIVLGGVALGAIVAALLPKSGHEEKILGGTGRKFNSKARSVVNAAREAGKEQIDSLGINRESAREQFRELVTKATAAVKAAGQAASDAAKKPD